MTEPKTSRFERLSALTAAEVVAKASAVAFGHPLIVNHLRSQIVEAMIAEALSPEWDWVSGDWAGWDFLSTDGVRLEVKQSAARQTWTTKLVAQDKCSFDIAPRTGHWNGDTWVAGAGRNAAIYIFAHHPIVDLSADHRDPRQWDFYVVPEPLLQQEGQKTISISKVRKLAPRVDLPSLFDRVEEAKFCMPVDRHKIRDGPGL